jgi:hypothetical protein
MGKPSAQCDCFGGGWTAVKEARPPPHLDGQGDRGALGRLLAGADVVSTRHIGWEERCWHEVGVLRARPRRADDSKAAATQQSSNAPSTALRPTQPTPATRLAASEGNTHVIPFGRVPCSSSDGPSGRGASGSVTSTGCNPRYTAPIALFDVLICLAGARLVLSRLPLE